MIALTSDFIPRVVYTYVYSEDWSLRGYMNSTLSGQIYTSNYYSLNLV